MLPGMEQTEQAVDLLRVSMGNFFESLSNQKKRLLSPSSANSQPTRNGARFPFATSEEGNFSAAIVRPFTGLIDTGAHTTPFDMAVAMEDQMD